MTEESIDFYLPLFEESLLFSFFFPDTAARALSSYPTNKYIKRYYIIFYAHTHTNKYPHLACL